MDMLSGILSGVFLGLPGVFLLAAAITSLMEKENRAGRGILRRM